MINKAEVVVRGVQEYINKGIMYHFYLIYIRKPHSQAKTVYKTNKTSNERNLWGSAIK